MQADFFTLTSLLKGKMNNFQRRIKLPPSFNESVKKSASVNLLGRSRELVNTMG